MKTKLQNKVALITCVSSGIGREIAQMLVADGALVFGTIRDPASANSIKGVKSLCMAFTIDADAIRHTLKSGASFNGILVVAPMADELTVMPPA